MQPQETDPASKQEPVGTVPPAKAPPKPMTADEKKGCGCMILVLLVLCFLLNKCACSSSSGAKNSSGTSSAANAFRQQFQYVFDGRVVTIGNFSEVEMMMFVKAIYEGRISDEDATRCLIYPGKCMPFQSCSFVKVVGQNLIFEGRADGREWFAIAVRRNASVESKHPELVNDFSSMRGTALNDFLPDEALVYEGCEEFRTKGGIVRRVPTFGVIATEPPAIKKEDENRIPITAEEYRAEVRSLFNDLLIFRESQRFVQHGFGELGYSEWKQRLDKLRKAKFPKGTDTTALSCLVDLGVGYEKTKGRDDESTLILSSTIRESLGIP